MADNPHRLPRTAIPTRYDIRLEPDLDAATFEGKVTITLDVPRATDHLVLNAIELTIHEATISEPDDSRRTASVSHDPDQQRITLRFDQPLEAGGHVLRIRFSGILNDKLHGFYRSTFADGDGTTHTLALTQFESNDARRCFPCWDEPAYKAVFGAELVVDPSLTAVSNSPEIGREPLEDGRIRIRFADTMRMSTYLVAFVVGPLEATDPVDVDGTPVRIVHTPGKAHMTAWAEETAVWFLRWLTEYYGLPYPGDKIDHVAVPDFAFGAMENLGCITYRETALLLDEATSGQYERRRIADVVAHELAHMWFGDLVTMDWWDGIWLNEAFASFVEMKAVDRKHPEWDRWLAFAADRGAERYDALIVDALASTRPVEFTVGPPEEANEMFDALTYGKGSAVLRMLEQYIGEDAFRRGINAYLTEHAYANTVTADLWVALDAASGSPVGRIMDTWILQGGYPLVEVTKTSTGVRLAQRRFLLIPDETIDALWEIPLQLRWSVNGVVHEQTHLLSTPEEELDLGDVEWIVANGGGHGFFRVAYDETLRAALEARIPELAPLERFTLLDDTRWSTITGTTSLAAWLRLADAYRFESSQQIWQMLITHLGDIDQVIPDTHGPAFRAKVAGLLGDVAERVGAEPIEGEDGLTALLRSQIRTALGTIADDPEVVAWALDDLPTVLDDFTARDPDLTAAVVAIAGTHGDAAVFERLLAAHATAPTAQLAQHLLGACARTRLPQSAVRLVDACLDGTVRAQDSAWVIARLLRNRHVRRQVWARVRARFDDIVADIPPMTQKNLATGLAGISEADLAHDVAGFFAETAMPAATKTIAQSLEQMRATVDFANRELPHLGTTLQ